MEDEVKRIWLMSLSRMDSVPGLTIVNELVKAGIDFAGTVISLVSGMVGIVGPRSSIAEDDFDTRRVLEYLSSESTENRAKDGLGYMIFVPINVPYFPVVLLGRRVCLFTIKRCPKIPY